MAWATSRLVLFEIPHSTKVAPCLKTVRRAAVAMRLATSQLQERWCHSATGNLHRRRVAASLRFLCAAVPRCIATPEFQPCIAWTHKCADPGYSQTVTVLALFWQTTACNRRGNNLPSAKPSGAQYLFKNTLICAPFTLPPANSHSPCLLPCVTFPLTAVPTSD